VRAALEATAFQLDDLLRAFSGGDNDNRARTLVNVDGGMAQNDDLLQFVADVLDTTVRRPPNLETTACGAAFAAGLALGLYASLDDLVQRTTSHTSSSITFRPSIDHAHRRAIRRTWARAVARSRGWLTSSSSSENDRAKTPTSSSRSGGGIVVAAATFVLAATPAVLLAAALLRRRRGSF